VHRDYPNANSHVATQERQSDDYSPLTIPNRRFQMQKRGGDKPHPVRIHPLSQD